MFYMHFSCRWVFFLALVMERFVFGIFPVRRPSGACMPTRSSFAAWPSIAQALHSSPAVMIAQLSSTSSTWTLTEYASRSLVLEVLGNPGPRVRARSVEHLGRQGCILVFHQLFAPIPLVASITAGRTTSSRPAPPTSISGPRRGARLSIPSRTVRNATSASSSTLLKPMCWLLVVTIVLLPCLMYMSLSASHVVGPQQLDPSSSGSEHDVQLCRLEPSRAHVLHGGTYSLERVIVIRATKTTTCIRSICVYWTSQWRPTWTTWERSCRCPIPQPEGSSFLEATIVLFDCGIEAVFIVVMCMPYSRGVTVRRYHGKRMQRVFTVNYSADSRFVISGSDDTNVRIWKARASDSLGKLMPREQQKRDYYDKLKQRYKHQPEIKRIAKYRVCVEFLAV